ncbi:hypothetical protein ACTJK5_09550 [Agrobacterium sp. 22094]|uniref:hypothetical protein n=1 Tax=Agrobacterium sp. 22094 TaxID=3453872 RepID=UPI003F82DC1D
MAGDLFAIALMICVHAGSPAEVCAPTVIKGLASEAACMQAAGKLGDIVYIASAPDAQIAIKATCGSYDPADPRVP